ncbi:hypothetical protein Syun_007945 [Stephania yunnanensis]|uniref:Uncharacterized protein n=1 Tax=Stephania yunnanensis TaxID=152371 RepID=A0AAP0Q0Q7_9MAGN
MERLAMMFRTCKECYEEARYDVQAAADWCERRQRVQRRSGVSGCSSVDSSGEATGVDGLQIRRIELRQGTDSISVD